VRPVVNVRTFMRRYFPLLITAYFLTIFACSIASANVINAHFVAHPQVSGISLGIIAVGALVTSVGNFIVIRGLSWGIWIIAVLLVVCLLTTLVTFGGSPYKSVALVSGSIPLLALFLINSRRYRQMCKRLAVVRRQRARGAWPLL